MLIHWMDERMFAETMDPAPALSLSSSKRTFRLSVFDFFKPDSGVAFNLTSLGWEVLHRSCLPSQGTLGNPAPRFFQLYSWLKRLLWWINLSSASQQTTAGYCSNRSLWLWSVYVRTLSSSPVPTTLPTPPFFLMYGQVMGQLRLEKTVCVSSGPRVRSPQ